MRSTPAAFIVIIAASMVLTSPSTRAQERDIAPAEIQSDWVGKDLVATTTRGQRIQMSLEADGSANLSLANGRNYPGKWRTDDRGYCTMWSMPGGGVEECFTAKADPDGKVRVFTAAGAQNGVISEMRSR